LGKGWGASVPEKKEVVAGLRGKAGVAADWQMKSFEEGGAARRSGSAGGRGQRWPAVRLVVDAGAEKVPSSAAGLLFFLISGGRRCFCIPLSPHILLHLRSDSYCWKISRGYGHQ
jgi:hypothetical protein